MRVLVLGMALCLTMAGAALACTSVMVGKKATADGSVLVSYTCDGWYDHRLKVTPGGRHKADMLSPYNLARFYQKLLFFDERADLIYVAAFVARRFYDAKFFVFERYVLYPHDGVKFVVYTNARVAKCVIIT